MKKKFITLVLSLALVIATLTACGAPSQYDTMVIGTQTFDGVFNPMFSSSAYDSQVNDLVFGSVCKLDPKGVLIDNMGSVKIKAEDDGSVLYTVSIKKDLVFSDGEPATIDDLIFSYYVYADPTYDGSNTFGTLDIEGLKAYYYDTPDYQALVDNIEMTYSLENITEEDALAYLVATDLEAWWNDDYTGEAWEGESWAQYLIDEGGYSEEDAKAVSTNEEMVAALAKVEYDTCFDAYDPLKYYKSQMVAGTLEDGIDVDAISGIKKIDDYTCTIKFNTPNISGDKQVSWLPLIPEHYYGKDFTKGDLTKMKTLHNAPLGCGAYTYTSYDNNLVTLQANPKYFLGEPKTPYVKLQVVNEEDKVDLVVAGEVDVTDPSASLEIIAQLEELDTTEYTLVDNPGYGYIGINAKNVPDLNVRKGLMHLMNRAPAVSSYYGDLAEVIERPMTPTVAEYPDKAKEYYGYDPAKALEYFKTAGYELESGKLKKDGKQLIIRVGIGDASSHPSTPILTQMANDMADIGAELIVNDLQFSILLSQVQSDDSELDIWVMAWGNSTDCDLTQIFGSKGGSNYQQYFNDEIDALQAKILQTVDFNERAKLVAEELDLIMDAAVYMPVYQRKNMEIINAITINLSTFPKETTTFYNYASQIEKVEMN